MGELVLWTIAVFAVLGGPPLLIVLRERRRERREAHAQQQPPSEGAPLSSRRMWPGLLLAVWTL